MPTRRQFLRAAALLATASGAAEPVPAAAQSGPLNFFSTASIAEAGFVYGLPIVMNYEMMYRCAIDRSSRQFKAPLNQIRNEDRILTHKDTAARSPNCDTIRSVAWIDLRAEPVVVSVPAIGPKRYLSVLLCDGNLYNYGYIGSRTTGNAGGDFLVVGPDWSGEPPAGIRNVFRSTTQFSIALFRTQLFDPSDIDNIKKVQAGYKVQTLSGYQKQPPPPAQAIRFPKIDNRLLKRNFFEYLAFALQFAPAQFIESDIRNELARIGVGAGRTFRFSDLSLKEKVEIALGIRVGNREVDKALVDATVALGGWQSVVCFGDGAFYNGNWLLRGARAAVALYGDDPQEAVCLFTRTSADGETLDGSRRNYAITFSPGQLPPVNAFWSLTMYDGNTQFLSKNSINRYLVNSPMLPTMKADADGGLTVHIQHRSPGPDKEANWLPAPNGPILLKLRLYWPKIRPPSILPLGKGSWQPPMVKQA
ncbi:DUF1254 domain-containing protein [Bradyrhizobium sp.]|uniref:DUF1254 domain-containing protein n=1 Tax=Bradyrhizobium sp. TaxID=376 RepID=UPI003C6816AB